jgi:hypothetical protein
MFALFLDWNKQKANKMIGKYNKISSRTRRVQIFIAKQVRKAYDPVGGAYSYWHYFFYNHSIPMGLIILAIIFRNIKTLWDN